MTTPGHTFLEDLALVLCVAAATSILFQRLRQPVVLGYLIAGVIVGPHFAVPLNAETANLESFAEIGVVLLLFSLGLDFSLAKLRRLGPSAAFVAVVQVGFALFVGAATASALGWSRVECLFAGAMVSISSTVLIRKVFAEIGVDKKLQDVVGSVLVFEDLVALLLLAGLTVISTGAELDGAVFAAAAGRLSFVLFLMLFGGLVIIPRAIRFTVALRRRETLLVAGVGICFAMAWVAKEAGYSVALGAFLAGTLIAESGHSRRLEEMVEPLRDVFAAVFFVSVGMLLDPRPIVEHWPAVLALTAAVVAGKVIGVGTGVLLSGRGGRTALRAGLSMAQIGEFSFVIAGLGVASGATRSLLMPVAVAVSTITALLSPSLIRRSDAIAHGLSRVVPVRIADLGASYGSWFVRARTPHDPRWSVVRRSLWVIVLDAALICVLLVTGALVFSRLELFLGRFLTAGPAIARALAAVAIGGLCALPAAPILREARRLAAVFGEFALPHPATGAVDAALGPRRALSIVVEISAIALVGIAVSTLTGSFLPWFTVPSIVAAVVLPIVWVWWRSVHDLDHARAGAEVILDVLGHERSASEAPEIAHEHAAELDDVRRWRVPHGHRAIGATLLELELHACGATVLALTRHGERIALPSGDETLRAGDTLAITGSAASVARALESLDAAQFASEVPRAPVPDSAHEERRATQRAPVR